MTSTSRSSVPLGKGGSRPKFTLFKADLRGIYNALIHHRYPLKHPLRELPQSSFQKLTVFLTTDAVAISFLYFAIFRCYASEHGSAVHYGYAQQHTTEQLFCVSQLRNRETVENILITSCRKSVILSTDN